MAFDKFSFDSFFDPTKGKAAFDEIIKGIDELNKELLKAQEQAKKTGDQIGKNLLSALEKFEKQINSNTDAFEKSDKQLDKLQKDFEKQAKIIDKLNKDLEKLTKTKEEVNEIEKEALRLGKEREKLNAKIAASNTDVAKANAILKLQIQETNKELKENAKDSLGLIDNYTKLSKELNDNRKKWKNLAAEQKENTKEGKALLKTINKQDDALKDIDNQVGQNQRNVGNYAEAVEGLRADFQQLNGKLGGIASGLDSLNSKMNVSNILSFAGAIDTVTGALSKGSDSTEEYRKQTGKLGAVWDVLTGKIGKSTSKIIENLSESEDLSSFWDQLIKSVSDVGDEFDDTASAIEKQTKAEVELIGINIAAEKSIRALIIAQAEQEGALSELEIQRDSENQSLQDRVKFSELAIIAAERLARTNRQIAKESLDVISKELAVQELNATVTVELRDAQAAAEAEFIRASNELRNAQLEAEKERLTLRDDIIEQDLDFLIDGADKIKSINERLIANERTNLDERRQIFAETEFLQTQTLKDQLESIQEAAKEQIDINELLLEEDSKALKQQIQNSGLSERLAKRLFEIVNEEKLARQDLAEVERDLFDEQQERLRNPALIEAQEERLAEFERVQREEGESIEDFQQRVEENAVAFEDRLLQIEIDAISKEIENREERNQDVVDLEIEKNELLLDQKEILAERELEIEEKKNEKLLQEKKDAAAKQKEIANSPVANALLQVTKDRIQSLLVLAGFEALTQALQQGKTPQEASKAALQAIAAAAIIKAGAGAAAQGLHDGGWTGDGNEWSVSNMYVHKKEHVITANQTDKYGISHLSAAGFDNAVESNHFAQFATANNTPIEYNPAIVKAAEIDYVKIGQEVGKNIPGNDFSMLARGHVKHSVTRGNKTVSTIYKNHSELL